MNSNDFLNEDIVTDAHDMHQDHEVQMARQECYHAAERAIAVHKLLRHVNEAEGLEGWVSAKITLANDYFKTVHDYLEYQLMTMNSPVQAEVLPIAEDFHDTSILEKLKTLRSIIDDPTSDPQTRQQAQIQFVKLRHSMDDEKPNLKKPGVAEGSINELSVNTLSSYGKKAEKSARRNAELSVKHQEKAFDKYNKGGASADRSWDDQEKAEKYAAISDKRNAGANLAAAKLAKKFSKGVAEGVAETMPMNDAVKVLRQYGADHFKTTSNELHFYKNGQPMSVDLIWGNGGERSVSLSQLNLVSRQLNGQGVAEDASAGASSSGSVATVVKGGKGGTNLLGGPEYKGSNPFKKKKSK